MYFDVEWEHSFLEMRFHQTDDNLRSDDLDEHRLQFSRLAQLLSLVSGPLRLLDGDFPDREFMLRIVHHHHHHHHHHNINQVMSLVKEQ